MSQYSEYSRLRSIAQKRLNRLAEAGFILPVKLPTVKDITSGKVTLEKTFTGVQNFLQSGNVLRQVRKTGEVKPSEYIEKPKPKAKPRKPLTPEQRERKNRRARERRLVQKKQRTLEMVPVEKRRLLKSAETVLSNWKKAGVDLGKYGEKILTDPKTAQAFTEYIEYRFAQGDFNVRYMIDVFVEDFVNLMKANVKPENIINDFNNFLTDREDLENKLENMSGLDIDSVVEIWDRFVKNKSGWD